mmetsp:Transcript_566/g.1039  ORF Transcript_566/g.1039 Transcript_566/m.1039 type:complete len:573 (+) Transcript_566:106-1824(+)|eukprot:CAMPEP_0201627456 /NCGR_PEP_ID=MMETSP0493-20130528/2622_1 /ASSEMBLY_ACC=CAM_ASM_000838 /TAXON_ID=420259 /ORGANISM="Thalassiosira gravida, Strain GMp14c1" /LENGTH=572 /DNA_ID=CAMNT_0048097897 /DNA_START=78 /DNA_END=1796 /DNA_ORIENTATION=-
MTIANTTFLHFNDVYNVENAPRFATSIKNTRSEIRSNKKTQTQRHVITVFSGDAFSPSIMSTILRGEQMVPVLNALDIDVACLGNHDLDFGIEEFRELKDQCNFPWLCSNTWDVRLEEPLGGCREYFVLDNKDKEGGSKILFIGLVEEAWLDTLATIDPQDVVYESPSDFVKRRVPELKSEHGPFDAVVALTHMRMPNDLLLAKEAGGKDGVDIILGGHDHHYEDIVENGVRILNSGADFKNYTVVDCQERSSLGGLQTSSRRVDIAPSEVADEGVLESIQEFKEAVDKSMDMIVGRTKVKLDARFSEIRTKETNISNFLAELMTRATGADVAILNAGSIRADRFVDAGQLTMRDCCDLLPMADETTMIEVTAERLLLALENGVSQYPAMEGRFPCVDGVRFAFDPSKPSGSRVVPGSVYVRDKPIVKRRHTVMRGQQLNTTESGVEKLSINEEVNVTSGDKGPLKGFSPLDSNRTYSLVSKAYLVSGKDGFEKAFVGAPVLRDADECPLLPTILRNIFTELRALDMWKGMTVQGVVVNAASKFKKLARRSAADPYAINPCVDGRITNVAEA